MSRFRLCRRKGLNVSLGPDSLYYEGVVIVEAPVDPMTGMTLNLQILDSWIAEVWTLAVSRSWSSTEDLLKYLFLSLDLLGSTKFVEVRLERPEGIAALNREQMTFRRRWREISPEHEELEREECVVVPPGQLAEAIAGGNFSVLEKAWRRAGRGSWFITK